MIVTFLGTKGGTGTTTMTVNVGADVHRVAKRPTILVDLKVGPGDVALLLGLRVRHTVLEFLDQLPWLDAGTGQAFAVSHACGVDVLGGGDDWTRPSARDAEMLDHALGFLSMRYDFVVVDVGCAINASAVAVLQASDLVVLVANPDVPCLRNVRRLLDAARLAGVPGERLKILLNRASEYGVGSLAQIEPVLGMAIDWRLASDYRTMAAAVSAGVPISSLRAGDLQGEFETIARAIAGWAVEEAPPAETRGVERPEGPRTLVGARTLSGPASAGPGDPEGCVASAGSGTPRRRPARHELATSVTTVAPRFPPGASQNAATSGCVASRRCTAARCTPFPLPWTIRTSRNPRS